MDNNEQHPVPVLGRFVIVAPSINVQTYLLTYLSVDAGDRQTSLSPKAFFTLSTLGLKHDNNI